MEERPCWDAGEWSQADEKRRAVSHRDGVPQIAHSKRLRPVSKSQRGKQRPRLQRLHNRSALTVCGGVSAYASIGVETTPSSLAKASSGHERSGVERDILSPRGPIPGLSDAGYLEIASKLHLVREGGQGLRLKREWAQGLGATGSTGDAARVRSYLYVDSFFLRTATMTMRPARSSTS